LSQKGSKKSKGCGFLELKNAKMLNNALRLDNSKVNGRCIKVEMSCGGGGRSTKRMDKIKEKNKKLVNKGGTLI
jgi:nucleolar protein 6